MAARAMPPLRTAALAFAGAGTLFWVYTFYGIATAPVVDPVGYHVLAAIPVGLIVLVSTLPALILALRGRALRVSLILCVLGFIALQWLWWGDLAHELEII
jgi:hypothetical protein